MIYEWPFQVETGSTIKGQIHCVEKKDWSISIEIKKQSVLANTK